MVLLQLYHSKFFLQIKFILVCLPPFKVSNSATLAHATIRSVSYGSNVGTVKSGTTASVLMILIQKQKDNFNFVYTDCM